MHTQLARKSPHYSRQKAGCLISLFLLAGLMAACTAPSSSEAPATLTPVAARGAPGETPTVPPTEDSFIPDPTPALMDQVWQPPQPTKRVLLPAPTELADAADVLLDYQTANVGISTDLVVTSDGQVRLGGSQGRGSTHPLSAAEFDQLKALIARTDFFNLQDGYWQEDPPGVIAEITIVTITYKQGGRSQTVTLRGTSQTPPALAALADRLAQLEKQVRTQGTPTTRPPDLVGYYLQGTDYTWWLDVDVEGGLYYSDAPAEAHLSPEDLAALRDTLDGISGLGSDEWYTAPDKVRDVIFLSEHRAIITTYRNGEQHQWINALSGATVPQPLEAVLQKLAQLYDKYAPQ